MSLFICDKCGVIENTALGSYWGKHFGDNWQDESLNGLALCSLCAPPTFADGSINKFGGGWHDKFRREFPNRTGILKIGINQFSQTKKLEAILQGQIKCPNTNKLIQAISIPQIITTR